MINLKTVITFIICCVISAFLWWLGGYDFNSRGPIVMIWATVTGFWCAAIAALFNE